MLDEKPTPQMEVYLKFKRDLSNYVLKVLLGGVIIYTVVSFIPVGLDSTDNGTDRSGMALHIDNATGCHYLASQHGGMTPRLTPDGEHICRGQE